jgi:hypothetical protein
MPTTEQRIRNTRYLFGFFITPFLFTCMFGLATMYPLILNYNYTVFYTNWYIVILTFTIFVLLICIYLSVRIVRDTYADFIF